MVVGLFTAFPCIPFTTMACVVPSHHTHWLFLPLHHTAATPAPATACRSYTTFFLCLLPLCHLLPATPTITCLHGHTMHFCICAFAHLHTHLHLCLLPFYTILTFGHCTIPSSFLNSSSRILGGGWQATFLADPPLSQTFLSLAWDFKRALFHLSF